jgi:hypothetical protein
MNFEDQHRSKLDGMITELSGLVRRAPFRLCKRATGTPFYLRGQDRGKGQCTPQRYTRRSLWWEHEDLVDVCELLLRLLVVGGRRRLHCGCARVGVDVQGTRSIEFDFARANRPAFSPFGPFFIYFIYFIMPHCVPNQAVSSLSRRRRAGKPDGVFASE